MCRNIAPRRRTAVAAIVFAACGSLAACIAASAAEPLAAAHAHNDYEHPRPLSDALDHGFCSVEADIHLVDGQLLVAHDRRDARAERTLEVLYLDPLLKRVRANDGAVYPDGPPFTLLVDIKSEGTETYRRLAEVLAQYEEMLTTVRNGELTANAVTVVVSGNRDKELIAAYDLRHAGIDGRLSDLDKQFPAHLMPLVSDRWGSHFRWDGTGEFPDADRAKLKSIVTQAHANGQRLRFWATPESVALWRELKAAGVDLINSDDLPGLAKFLREAR